MLNTINILCDPKKLFWKQRLYKILEGQQRVLWYFFKKGLLRFTYQWQTTTNSFKTNPFIFFYQLYKLLLKAERIQDSESYSGEFWVTKLSSYRVVFFLLQHHPQNCLRQLPLSGKLVVEPKLHENKIVSLSRTCNNNEGITGLFEWTRLKRHSF